MVFLLVGTGFIAIVMGFIFGLRFGGQTLADMISYCYPEAAKMILNERHEDVVTDDEVTIRRLLLRSKDRI